MKSATITEAKTQLSSLLARVRRGETVVILDRGRPIARIESIVGTESDDPDGRLTRLERIAAIRRGKSGPALDDLARRPPKTRRGATASRTLVKERRHGR
ncbi:MAG TPA: type II toxin-antitoxin system prevent-host-death family antitoxin [Candidatus Polarisedimenticolaceae bacterium]|nr:type II toxin-antitoxin system prevent-host-death family antitoxin [Candidatus Polarisedimenticolaceae bacterium]